MSGKLNANTEALISSYQSHRHVSGLHHWDARLKLFVLVMVIGFNVVIANFYLSAILLTSAILLLLVSRVPSKLFLLFLAAPLLAMSVVIGGFSIGFGETLLLRLGPVTVYREGLFQGFSAALRVGSDVAWMALIFLTSHFADLLRALRWYRVPDILVESLAMMYRYAFMILDQFKRMSAAIRIRGGYSTFTRKINSLALVLAQMLLNAYDRAAAISMAMQARGAYAMTGATEATGNHAGTGAPDLPANKPILSLKHLKFSYEGNEHYETNDLSLEVSQGEIVLLCGPNGSGKSTLLKLIAGLLNPDSGQIHVAGREVNRETRNTAFEDVGLLFQDPNDQLFCTHVEEDVAFGPRNMKLTEAQIQERVDEAFAVTRTTHLRKRPIHHLSYGEMKRVALAGLVAMQPPLILLDEPAGFLDPASVNDLIGIIRHLNKYHGQTFIIVTHSMEMAAELATRMIIMQDGQITQEGEPRTILTDLSLLDRVSLDAPLLTQAFYKIDTQEKILDEVPLTAEEARKLIEKLAGKS